MAEENDLERTEPASPRRLEQAREDGQVARSQELGAFAVMATAAMAVWLLGGHLLSGFTGLVRDGLTLPAGAAFEADRMLLRLGSQGASGFLVIAPVLLAAFVAAMAAPMLLNGWLFSVKPLQPDFSRLNPLKGI